MKSLSVTIQMKATEQYFPVVLFIMLYKVILTFESVDEILKCDHFNERYRAVLSCGAVFMLYKVILTFEPGDEILKCGHLNERYLAVLSCGSAYYAIQEGSKYEVSSVDALFLVWLLILVLTSD